MPGDRHGTMPSGKSISEKTRGHNRTRTNSLLRSPASVFNTQRSFSDASAPSALETIIFLG